MTPTITTISRGSVQPWHDAHDETKLAALTTSMTAHGWAGAPIVVITYDDRDPVAITGSHRIHAARQAGIDIPTVDLDELLAEHGLTLTELDAEHGTEPGDELHYETIVRLDSHLPADVIAYYGLDAH